MEVAYEWDPAPARRVTAAMDALVGERGPPAPRRK